MLEALRVGSAVTEFVLIPKLAAAPVSPHSMPRVQWSWGFWLGPEFHNQLEAKSG